MLNMDKIHRAMERHRKSPDYIHPIIREYRERLQNDELSKMVRNKVMEIIMNKEELLKNIEEGKKIINDVNKTIEKLNQKLDIIKLGRFKPRFEEYYYFMGSYGRTRACPWLNRGIDNERYDYGNCFKEANDVANMRDHLIIHRKLKDIANLLNNGIKIDWENGKQEKYCLAYDYFKDKIILDIHNSVQNAFVVYCLNPELIAAALKEIGEEKLIKYLKEGF